MRKVLLTTAMVLCTILLQAQISSNADIKNHTRVTINKYPINGYLEHLPADYNSNPNKKYPMIVMFHGQAERGNGTTDLFRAAFAGPSYEVERNGKFCINGDCFIVISPQLATGNWSADAQKDFWNYILHQRGLRYDPDRIYLSGLSLGGNGVWEWISSDYPDANLIAAATVNAGWGNQGRASKVTQRGISVWGFHGMSDPVIAYSNGMGMLNAVKATSNPYNAEYKWTGFSGGGHNIWWMTYRMDDYYVSPNPYVWLASKRRKNGASSPPPPVSNVGPTVNAGNDVTINVNTGNATLKATANDPDGSIASYSWSKVSGPSVSMWTTNTASLGLSNFATSGGVYQFKITVTDNRGATASDVVTLTKQVTGSTPPGGGTGGTLSVNAGPDKTVNAATGSTSIAASTSGNITSYLWTKVEGPNVSMWTTTTATLGLSGFASGGGRYVFRLTVKDNSGATAHDDVVVVKQVAESGSNKAPTVSAGPDRTIDANTGSLLISANASDSDGSIKSWNWQKVSGPNLMMSGTGSSTLAIANISVGTYEFKVTVTDNDGAKGSDIVKITRTGGSSGSNGNIPPVVTAMQDETFGLWVGSALISSSSSDPDGSIVHYNWKKISGPVCMMGSTDRATMAIAQIASGIYTFEVTVTDNDGATASDRVVIRKLTTLTAAIVPTSSLNLTASKVQGAGEQKSDIPVSIVHNVVANNDQVNLTNNTGKELRIIIMGSDGRMITDEKTSGTVNSAMLSKGIYLYNMVTEDGKLVQKGRILKY